MAQDFEKQMAVAMKKAKLKAPIAQPFPVQKKQIEEELESFKQSLRESIENKNKVNIEKYLKLLFETRAKQTLLTIQNFKKENYSISEYTIKKVINNYYRDCIRLTLSIKK